jgi:hypothetical protein
LVNKWRIYTLIIGFIILCSLCLYEGLFLNNNDSVTTFYNLINTKSQVVIDRFEGIYAVCEKSDGSTIDIELSNIPKEAKEGDVLSVDGKQIRIDVEKTKKRKSEADILVKGLWKD